MAIGNGTEEQTHFDERWNLQLLQIPFSWEVCYVEYERKLGFHNSSCILGGQEHLFLFGIHFKPDDARSCQSLSSVSANALRLGNILFKENGE